MNDKVLSARLDRIEQALTAKGHPMQDYSALRMALLDLLNIVRDVACCCEGFSSCCAKPAKRSAQNKTSKK